MGRISVKDQEKLGVKGASSLFGVPLRTLQYWVATNLVIPKEYNKRPGYPTILSVWNLLTIGVICDLRSKGCSLQGVRRAIEYIGKMGSKIYERKLFVTEEDVLDCGSLAEMSAKEKTRIISLVKQQGQMFFVDLRQIKRRVNKELKREKIEVSLT